MNNEEDKIELRSEEFQEVLGEIPHWILRWGITVLTLITLLLLVGSAVFKYPDVISTTMTLTGTTPPAAIVARTFGKLDTLYVSDNQDVCLGEYLAVIENSAKTDDVLRLKEYLSEFNPLAIVSLPASNMSLGELQNSYTIFYSALFEYVEFVKQNYYPEKKAFINTRIRQHESLYKDLVRQKNIINEQLNLSSRQYIRDSMLNRRGVLSMEELEKSHNQYLQGCLSYEGILTSMSNMEVQITQMKESLLDIEYQFIEQQNALITRLNTQTVQLANDIRAWEMNYMITAPICGKITFTDYWVKNQNISTGVEIFNIIPTDSVGLIGKALLPMARSGKVKVGQRVNIRFDNFPENEFGMVKGTIKNISLIPTKNEGTVSYTVEIIFNNGLRTTYNKDLPFLPQMNAQADIITDETSLLERFFMPLRKIWNENVK